MREKIITWTLKNMSTSCISPYLAPLQTPKVMSSYNNIEGFLAALRAMDIRVRRAIATNSVAEFLKNSAGEMVSEDPSADHETYLGLIRKPFSNWPEIPPSGARRSTTKGYSSLPSGSSGSKRG